MTQPRLTYGDERISYTVYRVPHRNGKIAIHVHPDGTVQVDVPPGAQDSEIHHAVTVRARWIYNNLQNVREQIQHVRQRRYISGESHFYLGRRYQLKVSLKRNQEPGVKLYQGRLYLQLPRKQPGEARKALRDWYLYRSRDVFPRRIVELSKSLTWVNGSMPRIRLLEMKRQWGSCSPKGALVLNPHLVKAPLDCVDYVICHELCHLVEHNHSKRFYNLLDRVMPEWQSTKARLDGMASLLLNT